MTYELLDARLKIMLSAWKEEWSVFADSVPPDHYEKIECFHRILKKFYHNNVINPNVSIADLSNIQINKVPFCRQDLIDANKAYAYIMRQIDVYRKRKAKE